EKPRLITICDVSDSVRNASRFMLQLVWSLQECFSRVRSFAFVSEIAEVTHAFNTYPVERAIEWALQAANAGCSSPPGIGSSPTPRSARSSTPSCIAGGAGDGSAEARRRGREPGRGRRRGLLGVVADDRLRDDRQLRRQHDRRVSVRLEGQEGRGQGGLLRAG